jgi:adenylate kinase family enzyme
MTATTARAIDLTRVCVVGTSGSGKTTFARRLACIVGRSHTELDVLHWGPNWTARPEFVDLARAAADGPAWVIDGNYSKVRDYVWRRSTAIIWLDYAFATVLSRAVLRTARRIVTRERIYAGNRESLRNALFHRDGIPWWVLRTYHRRRREYPALLASPEYAHAAVVRLSAPAEAEAFLIAQQVGATSD